jgi:DNA replication protein DnaD
MDYKFRLYELLSYTWALRNYNRKLEDAKTEENADKIRIKIKDVEERIDELIQKITAEATAIEQIKGMIENAASPYDVNINII